jgi:glycosyltransferase involved in cell wall biosynthesis
MTPAISIIVRTLGRARLAEALESLCGQTRRDFEVVVIDMSAGASAPTLERLAARLPALRVLSIDRVSRPRALNLGIAAASAPNIGILDDDNLYDPSQIEIFVAGLAASGASYVYTGIRHATYEPDGTWIATREKARPFTFDDLLMGNFIYATGSAFRKRLWEDVGGYDERFDVLEDWEFLIRAAQAGPIEFLAVTAGESRKFTGVPGLSAFDLEIESLRRCHAGIYWKHRRLYWSRQYRDAFRSSSARLLANRRPPRSGFVTKSIRGWRIELLVDLAAWLVHNLRNGPQPH